MSRKTRTDSASERSRIVQAAYRDIKAPDHVPLDAKDIPFFNSVIAEFAKSEWSDHQLEMAAMLARMMADMEFEQKILREEGSIAYSEKGTPVVNPRKTVVQMLAGSILSMRRSLALHARAQGSSDIAKQAAQKKVAKDMEAGVLSFDDDLISRPDKIH